MQTTTAKLYSLHCGQAKTYLAAALFVAGNIALPQLCHTVHLGGPTWLPIYFFTLVGAYKYGWRTGLLTALASSVANSLLFGMPVAAALPRSAGRRSCCWQASCWPMRPSAPSANGRWPATSGPPPRISVSACRACFCKSPAAGHSLT